jgi:thiamine-monophosphate kinase
VLFGGDDYELLFTVPADSAAGFDAGTLAGVPVHRIGVIEAGAGARCERDGCVVDLRGGGYDHFA